MELRQFRYFVRVVELGGLGRAVKDLGLVTSALALCLHLGAVMTFFATMPYGKFAHGIYRSAALLKWAIERRQPSRLKLTDD